MHILGRYLWKKPFTSKENCQGKELSDRLLWEVSAEEHKRLHLHCLNAWWHTQEWLNWICLPHSLAFPPQGPTSTLRWHTMICCMGFLFHYLGCPVAWCPGCPAEKSNFLVQRTSYCSAGWLNLSHMFCSCFQLTTG